MHKKVDDLAINLTDYTNDTESKNVITWLCPSDTSLAQDNHEAALCLKQAGTGSWFVESDLFQNWTDGPDTLLWITGLRKLVLIWICSSS